MTIYNRYINVQYNGNNTGTTHAVSYDRCHYPSTQVDRMSVISRYNTCTYVFIIGLINHSRMLLGHTRDVWSITIFTVRRMSYNVSVSPACPNPYLGPSLAQVCPGSQYLTFMTLLDTFVRTQDKISQLCERVKPVDPPDYYYDFIVVGGKWNDLWITFTLFISDKPCGIEK